LIFAVQIGSQASYHYLPLGWLVSKGNAQAVLLRDKTRLKLSFKDRVSVIKKGSLSFYFHQQLFAVQFLFCIVALHLVIATDHEVLPCSLFHIEPYVRYEMDLFIGRVSSEELGDKRLSR